MTSRVKKILVGLLFVGIGIAWIPTLLGGRNKPKPLPEVPAQGGSSTLNASVIDLGGASESATAVPRVKDAAAPDSAQKPGTPPSTVGPTRASANEESIASIESSLDLAQSLLPKKARMDLDTLAASWSSHSAAASATNPSEGASINVATYVAPQVQEDVASKAPVEPVADPIDVFLASHPLQGILIGPDKTLANLGPLVVQVGTVLVPGLSVREIGERWVVLDRRGAALRVELAPFQARPSVSSSTPTSTDPKSKPDKTDKGGGTLPSELESLLGAGSLGGLPTLTPPKSDSKTVPSKTDAKTDTKTNTKEPHGS